MDKKTALEKALALIESHRLATLCTITSEGLPYATSVYVVSDNNLKMHFLTKVETAKWKHIEGTPWVALAVVDKDSQETLQVQGKASREEDTIVDAEVTKKFATIPVSPFWNLPIDRISNVGGYVLVKIEPTWARYASFEREIPVFVEVI